MIYERNINDEHMKDVMIQNLGIPYIASASFYIYALPKK